MRTTTTLTLPILLALSAGASAAPPAPGASPEERGGYLVRIMSCNDCHTPLKMGPKGPEPDMGRMLSGHPESFGVPAAPSHGDGAWVWSGTGTNTAFAGPWGITFTANLTPDPETGLGKWTEKTFLETFRTGRHMGHGRPVRPPMPVYWISQATDDDLKAIYAYLRTIPAVRNRVPQPVDPPEPAAPAK